MRGRDYRDSVAITSCGRYLLAGQVGHVLGFADGKCLLPGDLRAWSIAAMVKSPSHSRRCADSVPWWLFGDSAVRKLQFLSPTAQILLRHVKSLENGQTVEFAVPQILLEMRRRNFSIDKTLAAIDESCKAEWMVRMRTLG